MLIPIDWENTGSAPVTSASLLQLLTSFWAAIGPQWAPMVGASYSIVDLQVTDRDHPGGAFATYVPTAFNVGTKSIDTMPANVALVVSKRTGLSGRRNRGRMYTFGWVDSDATGSIFTSTAVNQAVAFVAVVAGFHNSSGTNTVNWVVVSIADLALKTIVSIVTETIADSMRRRLPGRGF